MSIDAVAAEVVCEGGSTNTLGTGVGVAVFVAVAVAVAVAVLVGVAVLVAVGVSVAVAVGVGVTVKVGVAVGVKVGVAVLVSVAVAVAVAVGVVVAVNVGVAVFVAVGVAVWVGVGVGVAVAVSVNVGVMVAVGALNVSEPWLMVIDSGDPPVSSRTTLESVSVVVPSCSVAKSIVVRMPSPLGPGSTPVVEQPKVTLLAPVVGAGQSTVRPVDPRKVPLVALTNERTLASHVSVKS